MFSCQSDLKNGKVLAYYQKFGVDPFFLVESDFYSVIFVHLDSHSYTIVSKFEHKLVSGEILIAALPVVDTKVTPVLPSFNAYIYKPEKPNLIRLKMFANR